MSNPRRLSDPLRTSTFRLSLAYSRLFTVGVGILLGAIYLVAARVLQSQSDTAILLELGALSGQHVQAGDPGVVASIDRLRAGWDRTGAIYLLVDRGFTRRAGNLDAWPFTGVPEKSWVEFTASRTGQSSRHPIRAHIVKLADGYLLVGTDITQWRRFQRTFRLATLWGIGSTALLGILLGLWLSGRLMSRVRAISLECERIMAGDLSRRLPLSPARDELDALSEAVNRMLARLDEQTGVLRATFDSAAHDLRGPLSRLRGRLEELLRAAKLDEAGGLSLEKALQDIDAVQKTLATLLQIAQAEARAPLHDESRIDLGALAQEIGTLYEPVARERGMALSIDAQAAFVKGSRQLLAQLVSNLIENALEHAADGRRIELTVRGAHSHTELILADRGKGIPPQDRERALRPFVRLRQAPSRGSGLGLSLVAVIVRLHAGQLALEDNAPGLRVIATFPA